ncbi:MAG TPA: TonB-dependent receptor [Candidatus Omnitrophota bacterium]|nr:TonB-dependent receptor [Candidatus Omnitrophota bacterium]
MFKGFKSRNERFRKIGNVLFLLCFIQLGWSFPFFHKEENKTSSVSSTQDSKSASQTSGPGISTAKQNIDNLKSADLLSVDVIASRLPSVTENIQDMPSNVTFKSEKELHEAHPQTFQDAVRDIEGAVFYDEVGNGVDSTFSLRGFNNSSAVVFLVDGVRVNEVDNNAVNFPLIPMRDVQSIQIERGSSSAVYGSNAFAGVVNITTGQASPKPMHLFGGLEWTSFHGLRFNQGVSGTIQDKITPLGGRFTYYFNGERDNTQGYRNHSEFRFTSFDIKTAYELPEGQGRFYVNIKHMVDGDHTPGEITLEKFQSGDLRSCNKPYDGRKFFNTIVSLGGDKRFWDDRILASILYSDRMNKRNIYTTYGTFTPWLYPQFDPYTSFLNMKSRDRDLTWQLKYDDQWKGLGNESLLGMEVRNSRQTSAERYAYLGNIQEFLPPTTDHSARYNNAAIFWRETLKICDKIIPFFGMRHDFNWLHTADAITPTNNVSQRYDKSTLSTGMTVKPFQWADVFGNYSQGFRVPTMDETTPYAGANQVSLKPESSDSYEVGIRLRYKEMAAYKFSYFLIDVNDEIQWDNLRNQYFNIAQTRRYGIEQRVDFMPIQEIKLYGSYTWMAAYVLSGGTSSLVEGRALGQIPANRFTLGVTSTPLRRWGSPYEGFRIGMNGEFTGRQHPSNYETSSQAVLDTTGKAGHWIPGYSVWNFITSYNWKQQEIYFKINNLFGEKYYSRSYSGTSWGSSLYPAGTYTWVNPGSGREFVLGTKWEF